MTNGELIDILSEFPLDKEVNFWIFSHYATNRGTIHDSGVLIKESPHTGETCIMLDIPQYYDNDIGDGYCKRKVSCIESKTSSNPDITL